jgi:hypothetical protein
MRRNSARVSALLTLALIGSARGSGPRARATAMKAMPAAKAAT